MIDDLFNPIDQFFQAAAKIINLSAFRLQFKKSTCSFTTMSKKAIASFVCLLVTCCSFAQNAAKINFNTSTLRESVIVGYSRTFYQTHEIEVGLRFHINRLAMPDDQESIYSRRMYASSFAQHLGVQLGYNWYFLPRLDHLKPFVFYELQAAYSTTRNHGYGPTYNLDNGSYSIEEYTESFGPFLWLQNTIGVGFNVDIWKSFYLFEKIGFNATQIIGNDEKLMPDPFQKFPWLANEFGYMISVGVGYRF